MTIFFQFYSIIKQQALEKLGLKQFQRNFFDPKAAINKPEWQVSIWPGYKTTIRQHEHELLLGCEMSFKVLRTDSALATIRGVQQKIQNPEQAMRAIKRALIGSVVISTYNNKTYRIDDVDFNSNPGASFKKSDGSSQTFAEYFKERYNLSVKDMKQPLLISMPKDKDKRRGDMKAVKMIPEFTQMTGFTEQQRNNFKMMNVC